MNLSTLADMPGPVKVVVMLASGAGLTGILHALGVSGPMVLVILAGLAFAGLVWAGFRWFLKWREKGKSMPFMGKLMRAAAGTPQGVAADPAKRARLDDLRKKFEEGVEKFRSAGKNIYSLPWYLLVGPSGAGKTEAIRHCNVGFPPGLQDYLQGAGGTLNMHWWFLNEAVILDTAGKMFMEEVGAGESSEWKEFLKLLKDSRGMQPINGMLLCIGVDSLIKDSADEIQEKAGKIARQLDLIQRTLDVRFPVYVLVTKCDLITGFREFFEKVTDPQLQHQILGWSNPSGLDEAFQPEKVDQHIESVRQRLLRRRFAHLVDPVHTDDPQARRTDQVDSLFALPDSLQRLSSRLRRYLELIFVAGEWSPKPLFLRGIYFTSSMRQGAELDEEVAKILGMPVDALPGGGIAEEKSYFLRDVFKSKVFKERGLVTRATNVTKQQRARRVAVIGSGIAAILLLIGFTVTSALNFQQTVSKAAGSWAAVAPNLDALALLSSDRGRLAFNTEKPVEIAGDKLGAAEVIARTRELADHPPTVPWVLRPLSWIRNIAGESLDEKIHSAHEAVLRDVAVRQVVVESRNRLNNPKTTNPWVDNDRAATGVLAGLLAIERGEAPPIPKPDPKQGASGDSSKQRLAVAYPIDMAKFCAFLVPDQWKAKDTPEGKELVEAARSVQGVLVTTYKGSNPTGWAAWPPTGERLDLARDERAIENGVRWFVEYWSGQGPIVKNLGELGMLKVKLEEFSKAETELAQIAVRYEKESRDDIKSFDAFHADWDAKFAELKAAWDGLEPRLKSVQNVKDLESQIEEKKRIIQEDAEDSFRAVLGEAPADPTSAALEGAADRALAGKGVDSKTVSAIKGAFSSWGKLDPVRKQLTDAKEKLLGKDDLIGKQKVALREFFSDKGEGGKLLARAGGESGRPACQNRFEAYQLATQALSRGQDGVKGDARPVFGKIADAGTRVEGEIDDLDKKLQGVSASLSDKDAAPRLALDKATGFGAVMKAARRHARYRVIEAGLASEAPSSADTWTREKVKSLAAPDASGPIAAKISRARGVNLLSDNAVKIDPEFNPDAAGAVFRDLRYMLKQYPKNAKSGEALDSEDQLVSVRRAAEGGGVYAGKYLQHWTRDLLTRADVASPATWKEFREGLAAISGQESNVVSRLRWLSDGASDALKVDGLAELLGEAAPDREKWVAEFTRSEPNLEESITARLGPWRELPEDLRQAKYAIGNKTIDIFKSSYLQAFACSSRKGEAPATLYAHYVDALRLRALETIGAEIERRAADNEPKKQPPLYMEPEPDAHWDQALSPQKVLDTRDFFLSGSSKAGAAGSVSGGKVQIDCVDKQLARIFQPANTNLNARTLEALNEWTPFLMGEGARDNQLQFRLVVLPEAEVNGKLLQIPVRGSENSQGRHLHTEVECGTSNEWANEVDKDRVLLSWTPLPLKAGKLKFSYYVNHDAKDTFQGSRETKSPWGVLELLAEPGARALDEGAGEDGASKAWAIPVIYTMPDGKKWHKWIKVEFNTPVPGRRNWPNAKAWGER